MARFFMRKDKLEAFKTWCGRTGVVMRRPLGKYEVLQVALQHVPGFGAIHRSNKQTECYTVDKRIVPLVMKFYCETDDADFFNQSQANLDAELVATLKAIAREGSGLPSKSDQLAMTKKPRRVKSDKPTKVFQENGSSHDTLRYTPSEGHPGFKRTA